jgi:hypothetical protein
MLQYGSGGICRDDALSEPTVAVELYTRART